MTTHNISAVKESYVLMLAQCADCKDYDWYVVEQQKKDEKDGFAIRLEEFLRMRSLIA